MLDPHPLNELGKGTIDPIIEARLMADGFVFAWRLTTEEGHVFIGAYRKPIAQAIIDQMLDARETLRLSHTKSKYVHGQQAGTIPA